MRGLGLRIPREITEYYLQSADAHHGHPCFFASIVLNDSRSVLLLLKTKFSGGIHHDGRTETTDHCPAPGWGRVWQDSDAAPDFHQHGEVVLPATQSGSQNSRSSMRTVRKAHYPESGAEAETLLFRCMPEQVVEQPP